MEFENDHLEKITGNFHSFYVEGFNIFALGTDQLPHLICVCPNTNFARAIYGLLVMAERAQHLKVLDACITSNCHLVPKVLSDGSLALVASILDEIVWKDGEQVMYNKPALEVGTLEYEEFVQQFLSESYKREEVVGNVDLSHPYSIMLSRLEIPSSCMPAPNDKAAVLKAMLDGIGESAERLNAVFLDTDVTLSDLLSAANSAERKRLYKVLAKKLEHELAYFSGTEKWYRHGGFWRHEILLTDGAMHLAEKGGRNGSTAFWLMDAIASYQGEKVLARHPFQVWKLIVTETEDQSRCARLACTNGNNEKPIVEQQIEYTDFLLDEIQLYASVEPVDETGKKKRVIILLPSEY